MARRRITSIVDAQVSVTEIGRIRFGERKPADEKRPGRPLTFPRVSSPSEHIIRQVGDIYGGEPQKWDRGHGNIEWDVITEGPLAIAVLPEIEPVTMAYEQWTKAINTVRCDGATCEYRAGAKWKIAPCICAERHAQGIEGYDLEDRPCKKTTRISVNIVGIEGLGRFRVDTKSHYASEELPIILGLLQQSGRAGWMQMRSRSRTVLEQDPKKPGQDKVVTKKFPVITVDAPFMIDEVMHLQRPENMAGLPAPAAPMLPRGTRPALPSGVDPRGPQVGDREPPPRDPPPVDLPPPTPPDAGDDDAVSGEVLPPEGEGEQGSLPVDGGRRSAPGDA